MSYIKIAPQYLRGSFFALKLYFFAYWGSAIFGLNAMLRGRQTITAIFSDETPKLKIVRGGYTFERDVLLAYRFFYWHKLKNRDFEVILGFLEMEFFISQRTIADKLTEHTALLKDIKNNNPNGKQLAKRYPHFNWL